MMNARAAMFKQVAADYDQRKIKHVPCDTCARPTHMTATRRCDGCWEIEHRLVAYLNDGGDAARSFVLSALERTK